MSKIHKSWEPFFKEEMAKPYAKGLQAFLKQERALYTIYPPVSETFNAFKYTALDDIKAVIVGQEAYHGIDQADGLAFSAGQKSYYRPPALVSIWAELANDIGCQIPETNSLIKWAQEGVLLLNSVLTVRAGSPGSHFNQGWETFTHAIISEISLQHNNVAFLLWGRQAQLAVPAIDSTRHLILKTSHPSPLTAALGFMGSRPFSKANQYLMENGRLPIDWRIN